ncbi:ATP-grasp domain-containing protein [Legionella londiniensis]|uniref:Carbamoyl phosphate synthase-like protein n=1 Tax=Legionella londiniensis TaxID=45068 RepID=A0A0W0VMU4_9GAMM|nr:ATP-grasp domain-containing protein [Legionella londiniensis]KTD21391.1 carbamoyl phosphate synthase-like protein [Legionella londiniensis]STX93552.1 carbamoyl phosphate synthase-like protein [Legionella londiniensis]
MVKVLIPEYLGQQVLSGIRSLYRNGDKCILAGRSHGFLDKVFKSRAIWRFADITPSSVDSHQYIQDIIGLNRREEFAFILPFGLSSYYAVAKHAKELEPYTRFMVSPFSSFAIANDKLKTAQHCASLGIITPNTYSEYEEQDLASIANQIQYPVVIKARSGSGVRNRVFYANNRQELYRYYQILFDNQDKTPGFEWKNPLIQEYIPGEIHDACTLSAKGEVITVLTQCRKMMYPVSGGVGALNITTHNPSLAKLSKRLLESLNWHGPAQIEFKFDPRDKQYKLIEINPKLWGTLDLSIKAGVNFPVLIRNYLLEEKLKKDIPYPADVVYKFYFPQYTLAFLQLLLKSQFKSYSEKHKTLYRDFDPSDPRPDILRIIRTCARILKGDWYKSRQ